MADPPQSPGPAPPSPEQGEAATSTDATTTTGPGDSPREEDLHHDQIEVHARSVATPPATPFVPREMEIDITSPDISEDSPKLYVARRQIQPIGLTEGEIADIIKRLEVDLEFALRRIKNKSQQKPWMESVVMIEMRMAGTLQRGSTKVTLRPCIWVFCGSKWCQKIVERSVKALNWFGPYKVHLVRKGGLRLATNEKYSAGGSAQVILGRDSLTERLRDDQSPESSRAGLAVPSSGETTAYGSSYDSPYMGENYAFSAQSSVPTQTSSSTYGSAGIYGTYPSTSATSSTRGYEYQGQDSSALNYFGYDGFDSASVTSSSVPSYGGKGSGSVWSDTQCQGTAASSAPSRQTHHTDVNDSINRQAAPIQINQLPCELINLTGCNVVFPGDDEDGWMAHVESHLGGKLPSKLRCWFCDDDYFDARQTSGGDLRFNFTSRMQHIRHHIVHEGFRPDQMLKDGHVFQHLYDHNLIDSRTYDRILNSLNPVTVPPLPVSVNRGHRSGLHHSTHRSRQSRLPEGEGDVTGTSSNGHHRRHRSNQHRSDHHSSDHYRPDHRKHHNQSASTGDHNVKTVERSNEKVLHNTAPVMGTAAPSHRGGPVSGRVNSGGSKTHSQYEHYPPGIEEEDDSALEVDDAAMKRTSDTRRYTETLRTLTVTEDLEVRAKQKQHDHLELSSTNHRNSSIALPGSTEHRLHVGVQGLTSLIGLSCMSTAWRGRIELSRSNSKVGGAMSITIRGHTALYGVTAGHGLVHQLSNMTPQSSDDPSIDRLSEDSDSASEEREGSPPLSAESVYTGDRTSIDSAVDLSDQVAWTPINHGISAEFLGIGFRPEPMRESEPDESQAEETLSGDIALFPMGSFHRPGLTNYYIEPGTLEAKEVISISENDFESILPVVILLGPEQTVRGTLQPEKFHFSMRGMAIDARQVRLSRELAPGSSGSWVVHDQTLHGMIVAVFPGECMALMVPSKRMISDVQKLLPGATAISVAIRH